MDFKKLSRDVHAWGGELGFQQIAITEPDLSAYAPQFRRWLAERFNGSMAYMSRNVEKRLNPAALVPDTLRIITARMDYLHEPPPRRVVTDSAVGYVSRYALGRDYHKTVRRRLVKLAKRIEAAAGEGRFRAFTDSAPVLEKPLAEKAGLGWIGKNTLLLNPEAGSYFFLGEIFTSVPLEIDGNLVEDQCGACRACITICPTQAIVAPRQLDARRCISYLTIENKGPIPNSLRRQVGNRIFGCDDCQIVCPWNRYAKLTSEPDFSPRHGLDRPALVELLGWDEQTFLARTEGSAIRRINYLQWVRNLAVAAGNAPHDPRLIDALESKHDEIDDAMVREHIEWALAEQRARA